MQLVRRSNSRLPARVRRAQVIATLYGSAVLALTFFGFLLTSSSDISHVQPQLKAAYGSILGDKSVADSKLAAVRDIRFLEPGYLVVAAPNPKAAYNLVRRTHGSIIAVATLNRNRVTLIARKSNWHNAVAELNGNRAGNFSFRSLWTDTMNWSQYFLIALGEIIGTIVCFFFLCGGELVTLGLTALGRRRLNLRGIKSAQLKLWRQFVPDDDLYGPRLPEAEFTIAVPEFVDHEEGPNRVTFQAKLHQWRIGHVSGSWDRTCRLGFPTPELADQSIPEGASIVEISDAWAEFCARVATYNARSYSACKQQALEDQAAYEVARAQVLLEQEERRQVEEQRQLARGGNLENILQPGPEMVRGLLIPE